MSDLEIKLIFYSHGLTSPLALLRIFSLTKITWAVLWKPQDFQNTHKEDGLPASYTAGALIHSYAFYS